jgi:hypothetical protein
MKSVKIYKTPRGFHDYGKPIIDSYGTEIIVRESSSAEGPHVWILIHPPEKHPTLNPHLNKRQSKELIRRLQTWIDEIPSRWSK